MSTRQATSPPIDPRATRTRSRQRPAAAIAAAAVLVLLVAVAGRTPASAASGDNEAVISAVERTSSAVVTIHASGLALATSRRPFGGELETLVASGSGVIVDSDGLILTNRHVVDGADDVAVVLHDGTVLDASVLAIDTLTDFALVQADARGLPAAELGDSADLRVGQLAIAIGNPLGEFPTSVSVGIISGLDRSIDVIDSDRSVRRLDQLIQTDAAINTGNSGGAVLDGDGLLIGITTAEAGTADGIGFALPIDLARPIIEQAVAGQDVARPYIGVVYIEIDAELAQTYGLPVTEGAWLRAGDGAGASGIVAGGPADVAGLMEGDIITAVDGTPVTTDHPLAAVVLAHDPGDEVSLDVVRQGQALEVMIELGTRPAGLGG